MSPATVFNCYHWSEVTVEQIFSLKQLSEASEDTHQAATELYQKMVNNL